MASSNANKLGLSLINPLFLANRFKYKGIYSPFLALYKSSSVIAFKEYFLKKRILVTGVGGRSIGSGILHALLRSDPSVCERWEVVSSDAIPFAWGLYTTPERLLLPYAQSSDYIPALEKAVDHFRIDAIVPGTQVEIEILSQHREKFGVPILGNRPDLVPLMMDKTLLAPTLKSLGLPFIETLPLECWSTIAHKFGFPLVVKPTINTSGSRGLHLVLDETEMKNILPLIDRSTQPCVQPYIGTDQDEYTVGVLSDINGNLIDSIVIRRELVGMSLHTARTLNGKTTRFHPDIPKVMLFAIKKSKITVRI